LTVDAYSYGRLVERGGYATLPAAGLVSRLDTSERYPDDGTAGVPAKV
jgi:hypothetical protein